MVDGFHIAILFITFFYTYLREIIEQGYLYISIPPLYQIEKGKTKRYAYSDEEKDKIVVELGGNCKISRYKGLGEMDANVFGETTMDPDNRTLVQVTIDDAEEAMQILETCMGDQVEKRRQFIVENALEAELDI